MADSKSNAPQAQSKTTHGKAPVSPPRAYPPIKIGDRIGRWTVIGRAPTVRRKQRALCRCDCGNEMIVLEASLKREHSRSCGCLRRDTSTSVNTTHGAAFTRLYYIYHHMRRRTEDPKCRSYKDYGARGIEVCKLWSTFAVFRDWALANGYHDDLTIERKDVNGNYEPENCTWIPKTEQSRNTRSNIRITIGGITKCASEWARHFGVRPETAIGRISQGIDPILAVQYKGNLKNRRTNTRSPQPTETPNA